MSLFGVIVGIELSGDVLRAPDGWKDAGFLLLGSGVIDREAHLSWPWLGVADGPAPEGGGGGVRHLDHDLVFGVSESWVV